VIAEGAQIQYPESMSALIGIDIGGTFIDVVTIGNEGIRIDKFPATPRSPAIGLFAGLKQLIEADVVHPVNVRRIVHGSTVATNTLLEGSWATTALLTTEGFRDVLEIGRQERSDLYDLSIERIAPIVPRDLRYEIRERIGFDGRVVLPLDERSVQIVSSSLRRDEIESVAVVLLFSFLHPEHEQEVRRLLEQTLDVPITLSSDVMAEFREYERTSTTVVCAALRPVIEGYLGRIEREARAVGLPHDWQIMQSSGSVTGVGNAAGEPARIVLSGPAAGVEGARLVGQLAGEPDLVTLDMGGTSCDVSLVRGGEIARCTSGSVAGYPISMQMSDIHTIGAGGGSIAWVDAGGALRVGPRSAGGDPGPACYGRGGEAPTVTDAHVVLGRLAVDRPLAGLDRLDLEAAKKAIASIADRLSMSVERAALGILEVADAAMMRAIRVITIERGVDPRGYALLAFGGAGPLHAASIARGLSISRVLVPAAAGVLSALGLVAADVGRDGSLSIVRPLRDVDLDALEGVIERITRQNAEALAAEGVSREGMRVAVSADLRYVGQSHELEIGGVERPIDARGIARLEASFHMAHEARFGHAEPERPVELVTVRVRVTGPATALDLRTEGAGSLGEIGRSSVWFDETGPVESAVYSREGVAAGAQFGGPALLVGRDATLLIPPGVSGRCDEWGTVHLETA